MSSGLSVSSAAGFVNYIWLTAKSSPEVNEDVGLKYISHRWLENPYWHLWFNELGGVFRLELKSVWSGEGYDWVGEFVVKYYPAESEECFRGLSLFEQLCRKSRVFEGVGRIEAGGCPCCSLETAASYQTENLGVPDSESEKVLPEDFFFAGKILLAKSQSEPGGMEGVVIGFETQNYWRVIMTDDYYWPETKELSAYKALSRGDTDRNFPGLDLTNFLYQKIILSLQAMDKYSFSTEKKTCHDGFVFYSDGKILRKSPDREIKHWSVSNRLKNTYTQHLPPLSRGGRTL